MADDFTQNWLDHPSMPAFTRTQFGQIRSVQGGGLTGRVLQRRGCQDGQPRTLSGRAGRREAKSKGTRLTPGESFEQDLHGQCVDRQFHWWVQKLSPTTHNAALINSGVADCSIIPSKIMDNGSTTQYGTWVGARRRAHTRDVGDRVSFLPDGASSGSSLPSLAGDFDRDGVQRQTGQ